VEVTRGLAPGERYAAANAFVLKSELGKSGAGHAH
jgi:cobalt-zinc-cadmium efflux system membrane fusion protein